MRRFILPALAAGAVLSLSSPAHAQSGGAQISGFGGTTFGTSATSPTFGGSLSIPLGDHVQIVGEAGRLTDIKPSSLDTVLDLTPVDVRMSAWYGEGGIRVLGSSRSAIRPYAEVTAGAARLGARIDDGGWAGAIANAGLGFLSRTEPLVGAGAGVMLQGGPLVVDVGYRYKRVLAGSDLASAFALGRDGFDVNQVRLGVGLRF